jgi:hypothetical protein
MSDWKLELSRELTLAHRLCTYIQYGVIKRSEEEETVKVLIELGRANAHAHIKNGGTPLLAAAVDGSVGFKQHSSSMSAGMGHV